MTTNDSRGVDAAEAADANTLRSIEDLDEMIDFIRDRWSEPELLFDDAVHDMKAGEAAGINNEGLCAQLQYLRGGHAIRYGDIAASILYPSTQ